MRSTVSNTIPLALGDISSGCKLHIRRVRVDTELPDWDATIKNGHNGCFGFLGYIVKAIKMYFLFTIIPISILN